MRRRRTPAGTLVRWCCGALGPRKTLPLGSHTYIHFPSPPGEGERVDSRSSVFSRSPWAPAVLAASSRSDSVFDRLQDMGISTIPHIDHQVSQIPPVPGGGWNNLIMQKVLK